MASIDIMFLMLQHMWFDFDAIPLSEKFKTEGVDTVNWDQAKQVIEKGTLIILEESQKHYDRLSTCQTQYKQKILEEYVQLCMDRGVLNEFQVEIY